MSRRISIPWLAAKIVGASLGAIAAYPAVAQVTVPPGAMTIDGFSVSCGGVSTHLVGPELNDVAVARSAGIYLNWPQFSLLPTGVKAFVYAHECGHMLYGSNENVADQFAIQIGKAQGWINPVILSQICASVYMSPGDWTHLPGPARCAMMVQYFHTS